MSIEDHPVHDVRWVHIDQITHNAWNPNSVAKREMNLLYASIKADGYTMPIVTMYNKKKKIYEIVDGFHRYTTMKYNQDIYDSTGGMLPVVVIDKPPEERMASTVRHNRARGKHSVAGMADLVFKMLAKGKTAEDVCNDLGLEPDEFVRLTHISGFSKLFGKTKYSQAMMTEKQVKGLKEYKQSEKNVDA